MRGAEELKKRNKKCRRRNEEVKRRSGEAVKRGRRSKDLKRSRRRR